MSRSINAEIEVTMRQRLMQEIAASPSARLAGSLVERALSSIGCHTELREAHGLAGIAAERGHQRLVALVDERGRATFDIAGCDADACEPFQRELERAALAHGGVLRDVRAAAHADDRGGALIQHAALAAGGGSLADGVLRYAAEARRRGAHEAGIAPAVPQRLAQGD
jgi:hypothetical protein